MAGMRLNLLVDLVESILIGVILFESWRNAGIARGRMIAADECAGRKRRIWVIFLCGACFLSLEVTRALWR